MTDYTRSTSNSSDSDTEEEGNGLNSGDQPITKGLDFLISLMAMFEQGIVHKLCNDSPFIDACVKGNIQELQPLLDKIISGQTQIDPEIVNNGFTNACRHGKLDVVKLLLQRENDLPYSFDMFSGLEYAKRGENSEIISFLEEKIKKDAQPVKQKPLIPLYRISSTLNENPPKAEIEIGGHNLRKGI